VGQGPEDATVSRLGPELFRWTAAEPNLRWLRQNATGLDVQIEDVSEQIAALALQGPTAANVLRAVSDANIDGLKYFRMTHGKIAGRDVDISRTGYTGDLGYEVWMKRDDALKIWDVLIEAGRAYDLRPTGLPALDVARGEAGPRLSDVDFLSPKKRVHAYQF